MSTNPYDQLAQDFRAGRIDRREVIKRASALGLSARGLSMLLAWAMALHCLPSLLSHSD